MILIRVMVLWKDAHGVNSDNHDSVAIVGQVTLSSSKAFSITPGDAGNHFTLTTAAKGSDFVSLNNIDLSTKETASLQ